MQITAKARYRAYYHPPRDAAIPSPSDTGVLPYVQFHAANAEHAHRVAHALTGCPIDEVQRLEPADFTLPTDSVFAVLADAHDRAQAGRFAA